MSTPHPFHLPPALSISYQSDSSHTSSDDDSDSSASSASSTSSHHPLPSRVSYHHIRSSLRQTLHPLPPSTIRFFRHLEQSLHTRFFFFGSVQRQDFFPGKSDIDVDIFSSNTTSTIALLAALLHIPQSHFQRVVWRLNDRIVYGFKLKYSHPFLPTFNAEFSIYNRRFRHIILREHHNKLSIPWLIGYLLIFIKLLFYQLHLISPQWYSYFKRILLSYGLGQLHEDKFLVLPH